MSRRSPGGLLLPREASLQWSVHPTVRPLYGQLMSSITCLEKRSLQRWWQSPPHIAVTIPASPCYFGGSGHFLSCFLLFQSSSFGLPRPGFVCICMMCMCTCVESASQVAPLPLFPGHLGKPDLPQCGK